jgi:N-acetylmuramoyl-L-alanine amidase
LRLLLSFVVSIILFFPFSIYAYAEEQGNFSSPDKNMLLEIRDFEQPSPFEKTATSVPFTISSSKGAIFSDVPLDHWAKKEIEFLYNRSIIQGYEQEDDLQFHPNEHVTRAQAAKMLMKVLGEQEQSISYSRFKDVPSDHWAAGWIERAVEKGIFEGYSDGTFHPNDPLKRSQMSKIIALAFQLSDSPSNKKNQVFTDVSSDYWASPYILKLYFNGISNGNQNKFMPEAYISRDQFSAFLARAMSDDFRLPVVDSSVIATGKVTAKSLNVRSAGNANASIVGKLSYGAVVNVYEINGY